MHRVAEKEEEEDQGREIRAEHRVSDPRTLMYQLTTVM